MKSLDIRRLVLARYYGEGVSVDGPARFFISHQVGEDKFQVVIEAPASTTILRDEIVPPRGKKSRNEQIP